ncbi:MAG: DUF2341 domain-containing protein [Myxococcaceae bacterium]|nr:DUF2341 domain-containing protein [Myxococcaceae bacterium]
MPLAIHRPPSATRPLALAALLGLVPACQFAVPADGLTYRCEADGGCPTGLVCVSQGAFGLCLRPDAGTSDGGTVDAGTSDGGLDAGGVDAGKNDGGALDGGAPLAVYDLIFDNADGGSLDGFPVLIAIAGDSIRAATIQDPRTQLRFFDPDTQTDLPFQIDTWAPNAESLVWVRVPNIAPTRTDRITLMVGPDAGGHEDATGQSVFGAYAGVWHLGPGALDDSSGSGHHGTSVGAGLDAGFLGSAVTYVSTGDEHVELDGGDALFNGWGAFTLELWLRADYATVSASFGEHGVLDQGGGISLGRVFAVGNAPNRSLVFQTDMHFTPNAEAAYLNAELPLQQWTWFVYTFDGHTIVMYADGVEATRQELTSAASKLLASQNPLFFGDRSGPLLGGLDEVRISRTAFSPAWIAAQHRSMRRSFVTLVRR